MNIPKISALYESSLASALSAAGSSCTVVSATDRDGNALSGRYGIVIDEGSADEEFLIGTFSGNTYTIEYRGLDADAPNTEVSANKKAHRRGASVKITDYPVMGVLRNILNGDETLPNVIKYASGVTPTNPDDLVDKEYVDTLTVEQSGVPDASTNVQGSVEIATQAEVDAGTEDGAVAKLVITPNLLRAKAYHDYAVDSVGTDAYAITITPTITAYAAGQVFTFKAGTANTGACTLNVSGLGAKDIKKHYNQALVTGDILANQIVTVVYDGTNMQVISQLPHPAPTVQTFTATAATTFGDTTTQFDITNPGGSTFRYTWDTTGTDPGLTALSMPAGTPILIESSQMNTNNTGNFTVTGSGANYFEISNSSGVAETNKTLQNGYLKSYASQTYTKSPNVRYAILEVQGAGAAGAPIGANSDNGAAGGGAGAYSKKLIAGSLISSTETVYVGIGATGAAATGTSKLQGGYSKFGSLLTALGGIGYEASLSGGAGATATGGDLNISGGHGESGMPGENSGRGGDSFLGRGGQSLIADGSGQTGTGYGSGGSGAKGDGSNSAAGGGNGAPGIVIVTEYYA